MDATRTSRGAAARLDGTGLAVSTVPDDMYADAAKGWATGAARLYAPLAVELVRRSPHPLTGRLVLDVGAGTGCGSAALRDVGARPVAGDLSHDMLRWDRGRRPPAFVGDVTRLPVRNRSVDDSVAAFVLNHLPEPLAGLAELVRVTRADGAVLASVFSSTSRSAVRDRVDEAALSEGFVVPDWYLNHRQNVVPLLGSVTAMSTVAKAAGLVDIHVHEYAVDVGVSTAMDLVDYRLGQAHYTGWLAAMSPGRRADVRARLVAAVDPVMEPYRPTVVILAARSS